MAAALRKSKPPADSYTYADAKCNSDSDADAFGHTERNPDTYSYSYSDTDSHAGWVCILTRLLEKPSSGMAGDRVAAGQCNVYTGSVASDSARTSPREWNPYPRASGNCRETEHSQRCGWKLHPANIS